MLRVRPMGGRTIGRSAPSTEGVRVRRRAAGDRFVPQRLEDLRPEGRQDRRHPRRRPAAGGAARRRPAASPRCATSPSMCSAGEVFVVMGLSGSGKSTLVRMLNRLHDPTAGEVLLDGEDIMQLDEERLREVRRTKISHGVPALRAAAAPPDRGQRGVRARDPRASTRSEREAKANEVLETVGLGGLGDVLSRRALRRDAAARRARARARDRPRDHAVRRAVQRAGPADPPRHAGRGDPSPARRAARR